MKVLVRRNHVRVVSRGAVGGGGRKRGLVFRRPRHLTGGHQAILLQVVKADLQ